ncbi:hypothetical protein D3C71_966430 [compost metagenome]
MPASSLPLKPAPGIRQSSTRALLPSPVNGLVPPLTVQPALLKVPLGEADTPMKVTVRPAGGTRLSRMRVSLASEGPWLVTRTR